jgi:GAF domain-containing protein
MTGTAGEEELRAAVAAGVIGSGDAFGGLLTAITEVSRAIFGAAASSILLLDEETDELVFEAVAGYGEEELLGLRFPSGTGIAGWVLSTRTPLILDDVQNDPRFAKDFAAGTGYVPRGLMAVPLLYDERALGVLEVLDRPQQAQFSLHEMEVLGLFANQAAIALDLLQRARQAERLMEKGEGELAVVARLAAALTALEGRQREAGIRLLRELAETLGA